MEHKFVTFVRHGQSLSNIGGVTVAHEAIPLTAFGHLQARRLAELLPQNPSQVLASAFIRTQQTAAPYCERVGLAPRIHPLTHEFCTIDSALLEGMTGAERRPIVDAYWEEADPAKRMGQEAETFGEFELRVETFIAETLPGLTAGTVLFGHGLWMGMLFWKLLGFKLRDSRAMKDFRRFQLGLPMPNGAIYRLIETAGSHWKIQADDTTMRAVEAVEEAE